MDEDHRKERKPELTLDEIVKNMQAAWHKFRYAQLYTFHAAVPALEFARVNPDDFHVYCQDRSVKGDLPETQVADLMIQDDADADAISRERRAEYGAAIGWFADRNLCAEVDAEKAVQLAKQKGRIKGIAALYRNHKEAENPEVAASKNAQRPPRPLQTLRKPNSARAQLPIASTRHRIRRRCPETATVLRSMSRFSILVAVPLIRARTPAKSPPIQNATYAAALTW